MFKISSEVHYTVYFGALILLAVSLPFSEFTLSVAQITLMINWLVEGKFRAKWDIVKKRRSILIISLFYLVHLIWMMNTSDLSWGFHDLKIKLPFLVLPWIIGTSPSLKEKKFMMLLNLYLMAVLTASLYSSYKAFGFDGQLSHSVSDLSPFVWSIRWSLMVVMAIFIAVQMFSYSSQFRTYWIYIPLICWLIFYLLVLKVLTGIIILVVVSAFFLGKSVFLSRNLMIKWFATVLFFMLMLLTTSYIVHSYARFSKFDKMDIQHLDSLTSRGNRYHHEVTSKSIENGHYIYFYICPQELRQSWEVRSHMDINGKAKNGAELKTCLVRYLTSKGLRKDADGMNQLTDKEIKYIEWGTTNYIDTCKYSLYPRVYEAMWELYTYHMGGNPSGYSISQRFEFLKTAVHIIKRHFWIGSGTGDAPSAFALQYEVDKSQLTKDHRFRAHNQLVTSVLTFGICGAIIILFSLIAPPILEKKFSDFLFLAIFLITFLSFLNEDTLETHQGISFVTIFYSLFLFHKSPKTMKGSDEKK